MHICLDVDDTITYAPEFFVGLCRRFDDARVTIVTFRSDEVETRTYLDEIGLRYDRLIVSTDQEHGAREDEAPHEWKAALVNRMQPDIFFEDMPEVVSLIHPSILVFMPCDDFVREWLSSRLECEPHD